MECSAACVNTKHNKNDPTHSKAPGLPLSTHQPEYDIAANSCSPLSLDSSKKHFSLLGFWSTYRRVETPFQDETWNLM